MCGIVGYIGHRQAYPILIKGLKRLEYRGYDSAGVALINDDNVLGVYKTKGKVSLLEDFCEDKDVTGTVGIAHTRWATHGEPSSVNAHPHYSESHNLAIIHNGIIENYADLKRKLIANGVHFKSDTDTEVLVQLIEYIKNLKQVDLLTAVQLSLQQVIGAYAIAILDKNDKNQIIAARKQSPLVVGIGEGEFFIASDASPIVEYTDKVVYLDDDNIAVIRLEEELKVVNVANMVLHPEVKTIDINLGQIEKGGFPHFMLKEIFEQPVCITNCMRGRINVESDNVTLSAIIDHKERLLNARRIIIMMSLSLYRRVAKRPIPWLLCSWQKNTEPSSMASVMPSAPAYQELLIRVPIFMWDLKSVSLPQRLLPDKSLCLQCWLWHWPRKREQLPMMNIRK